MFEQGYGGDIIVYVQGTCRSVVFNTSVRRRGKISLCKLPVRASEDAPLHCATTTTWTWLGPRIRPSKFQNAQSSSSFALLSSIQVVDIHVIFQTPGSCFFDILFVFIFLVLVDV